MAVITTKQANGSFANQAFDEVVGSTRKWFTLAGNLLDGTYHPIPADGSEQVGFIGAYLPDVGGNIQRPALNLDGIDDYTDFPYSSVLQPDSITIELKVQLTSDPDTDANNWRWLLNPRGWTAPCFLILEQHRAINFTVRVGGTDYRYIGGVFSGEQIAVGEIAWLTYAYDSVTGYGYAYKNGVLSRSGAMVTNGGALDKSSNGWRFSWPSGTSTPNGQGCFPGVLLELRIWNYVRSQAEVQRDMNKPLKGDESGLIGYWTIDEGSGNVVYDKTANANHGTIYGATWTQVPGASVVRWKLDTPRPAHKLRVHGDTQRNIYPVDFGIQLYDANANKLLERQVRGNTQVQRSEVLLQTYDFVVMDVTVYKMSTTSPVTLTEASNKFSVVRKDTLLPKVVDAKLLVGVGVWSADTLLPKLADSRLSTTASFAKMDTLLPKIADSSFFRQYEFRRVDTLLSKITEATLGIAASFMKQDTLLPKVAESKQINVSLIKTDVLLPKVVEAKDVTVNFTKQDTLKVQIPTIQLSRGSTAYLLDGTQVATNVPRFEPGKFGQAVMVEEGTDNKLKTVGLADVTCTSTTGWTYNTTYGSLTVVDDPTCLGGKCLLYEDTDGDTVNNQWDGFYPAANGRSVGPVSPGGQITLSIRYKTENVTTGRVAVWGHWYGYDSAGNLMYDVSADWVIGPSNGVWQKKTITLATLSPSSYPNAVSWKWGSYKPGFNKTNLGARIYVDWVQAEVKPYATSFANGIRSPETLTIPTAGVLNLTEGTIECWVYVNSLIKDTSANRYIFAHTTNAGSPYPNTFALRHTLSNTWDFWTIDSSGNASQALVSDTLTEGWHYFACRWTSSETALFIDGTKVAHVANPYLPSSLATNSYLGVWARGGYGWNNTLIDDLRISSRARTDAEIAAAYQSGQPLSVDEWTTLKMHFDGSLVNVAQSVITNTFSRPDTLLPKVAETKQIQANFTKQDVLLPKVAEAKYITARFTKADIVLLSPRVEDAQVTVNITRPDMLLPVLAELSTPTNVHTKVDADERTIYGKVEVTYSDPFTDETIQITTSGDGRYTYPQQATDGLTEQAFRWFALHDSKLDGSYHLLPSDKRYSIGWWSDRVSDSSGIFSTPVTMTVTFQPRTIQDLQVIGDNIADNYPVDFTITLYDQSNVQLYQEVVTGNNNYKWYKDIVDVNNVAKMTLSITKISKPNQPAKIAEFFTALVEVYDMDRVSSIHLLEELEYPSGTLQLGAVSANEIDVVLNNADKYFSLDNRLSPVSALLKRNRRVRAWLGVEVVPNQIEWYQLGVFWTMEWKIPTDGIEASFTARDRLELLRSTTFTNSQVYTNYSLYSLFELVLLDAGLKGTEFSIDTSLQSIIIPYAWFDRMSHRDAIQKLASCAMVQVYCDRDGLIVIKNVQPTATVMYAFDDDKNIFSKDFPSVWAKIANYVEVQAVVYSVGASQLVLDDSEVFSVPANSTVTKTYSFTTIPVVSIQAPVITADTGISVQSYQTFAWGVTINFQNTNTVAGNVFHVTINGTPLQQISTKVAIAQDDALIKQDGKISATIQHEFIQTYDYAKSLADSLLASFKQSTRDLYLNCRGNIALKLGDRVTAPSEFNTINEYMVTRQNINWGGFLEARVEGKAV